MDDAAGLSPEYPGHNEPLKKAVAPVTLRITSTSTDMMLQQPHNSLQRQEQFKNHDTPISEPD
jgi:hypothetical protein